MPRFAFILTAILALAPTAKPAPPDLPTHHRRPVALVTRDNGRHMLVANRASGTISIVNIRSQRVLSETRVGQSAADVALTPDQHHLLVLDPRQRLLTCCRLDKHAVRVAFRIDLPLEPTRLAIHPNGKKLAISSRWSSRVLVADLPISEQTQFQVVSLPVPGRHLIWLPVPDRLIVADAFGGQLTLVDSRAGRPLHTHQLPAHNIAGLAISPDNSHLVVSHQVLNSAARTTNNDVFWGLLMTNNLRRIPLPDLLGQKPLTVKRNEVVMLGQPGQAAGDPAGVAIRRDGSFVVALSGTNQVGTGRPDSFELARVSVGRRPTGLWLAPNGARAIVTCELDDRIDVIDLGATPSATSISLGPRPELTPFDRGERLFFDASLSRNGWMSCHSCHTDGHSNGRLADTLGDGHYGNAKRVLSLLGTIDTRPWAWDGRMSTLRAQVTHSVATTMRGAPPTPRQLGDLVAFIEGLEQPAPARLSTIASQPVEVLRGQRLFGQLDCRRCHAPPLYTTPDTYDVGIGDLKANPPSLRGVSQRPRLFHDNRARSLEEVIGKFEHQLPRELTERERRDLLSFLRSL